LLSDDPLVLALTLDTEAGDSDQNNVLDFSF